MCVACERERERDTPGKSAEGGDDNPRQAEGGELGVLVQEHFDTALDLLQLILTHGHARSLRLQPLHLTQEARVRLCRVVLQRHLHTRQELTGGGRRLGGKLHLVTGHSGARSEVRGCYFQTFKTQL